MMIPTHHIAARMHNCRDALLQAQADLPWWAWKRRLILRGAIAAYREELVAADSLTLNLTPTDYERPA